MCRLPAKASKALPGPSRAEAGKPLPTADLRALAQRRMRDAPQLSQSLTKSHPVYGDSFSLHSWNLGTSLRPSMNMLFKAKLAKLPRHPAQALGVNALDTPKLQ